VETDQSGLRGFAEGATPGALLFFIVLDAGRHCSFWKTKAINSRVWDRVPAKLTWPPGRALILRARGPLGFVF